MTGVRLSGLTLLAWVLLQYNPVFTAHPTEARRREVLTCLHRIFLLCNDREVGQQG